MPAAAPRDVWTDRKPNFTEGPKKVKIVYIHHTAAPTGGFVVSIDQEHARMRAIEASHLARGWVAIGYSKVVMGSGRAYDGRGWGNKQGANYDGGTNETTYSISFDGDFTSREPTDAAFATAAALIAEGVELGWIDPDYVLKGHREEIVPGTGGKTVLENTGKDCPGKMIYTQFDRLEEEDMTPEQVEQLEKAEAFVEGVTDALVRGRKFAGGKADSPYRDQRVAGFRHARGKTETPTPPADDEPQG